MGRAIDSKVVEMKFDNKQFESGVKQSLGTLERLKKALQFKSSSDPFSGISKSAKSLDADISGIAKSVSALEKRFSFLGETVRNVANSARDTLVNTLGKGISFVTDSIVTGGIRRATNIENAHFQLQALLKDEEKVQAVMDDAMDAVDGTAYGFDEAAKAASMFAATGMKAGKNMQGALKGVTGVAAMTNSSFEDISLIFTTVAGQGRLMGDQLLQLAARGLNAPATIAKYFNDVAGGTENASKKVTKAIEELTNGTKVTEADIREMVSNSQISFDIFAAAMGSAFGDSAKEANKTFNGSLANMKASLARIGAEFVSPLVKQESAVVKLFNTMRDAINRVKKEIAFDKEMNNTRSLSSRFTDSVLGMAKAADKFVSGLDIESGMDVFYNVIDSGINIVKVFASWVAPLGGIISGSLGKIKVKDVVEFTSALKDVTAKMSLTKENSDKLAKGFQGIASIAGLLVKSVVAVVNALKPTDKSLKVTSDGIFDLVEAVGDNLIAFSKWVEESELVEKGAAKVAEGVKIAGKFIKDFVGDMKQLAKAAKDGVTSLKDFVSGLDFSFNLDIDGFIDKIIELKETANFDILLEDLHDFEMAVEKYAENIGNAIKGMFTGQKIASVAAGAGGVGIILSVIKIAKAFEKAGSSLSGIPKILDSISGTLKAYQAELKADALKKTASAILMLSGAIVVLSFTDTEKALQGAKALSLVAGTLVTGVSVLTTALSKANIIDSSSRVFARAVNNLAKSLKWKAIGGALKDMGVAIIMIIGAIAAIGYVWEQDAEMVEVGILCVTLIAAGIAAMTLVMGAIGQLLDKGMSGFLKASAAVAILSATVLVMIEAVRQIFDLKLPVKWQVEKKLKMLAAIIAALMAMTLTVGISSRIAGKGSVYESLIGTVFLLKAVVNAIKDVFAITLPEDMQEKMDLLNDVFVGLMALIVAVGVASGIAQGNIKAAGTLLALCVVIGTITASLMILSYMPAEGMIAGAIALGAVLLGVAGSLLAASKIGNVDTYKSVLSMAIMVGAIVAAIAVLSIINPETLIQPVIALGVVLLGLATNFAAVSNITNEAMWKPIVAMVAVVVSIAGSIAILSSYPWESLIASSAALGITLLTLSGALAILSKSKVNNTDVLNFVSATIGLLPITAALAMLSGQSWGSILPGAVALNATAAVLVAALVVMTKTNVTLDSVIAFVGAAVALIPIAAALKMLAGQSWGSITPGAVALNATVIVLGAALVLMSKLGTGLGSVVGFVGAALALIPIAAALKMLAGQSWGSITPGAVALNATVIVLGATLSLMSALHVGIGAVISFVGAAVALIPIAAALKMLAGQSWGSITPGAVALNATAAVLGATLVLISKLGIGLGTVVGFVAATVALIPIAGALKMLSGLSWEEVATGLVALAGGLTIIGVAGVAGTAIAPGLLALSAALLVFAAAIAAVGAGILVFAATVTQAIVLIDQLIGSLSNLPAFADAGAQMVNGLINGIKSGIGNLVSSVSDMANKVIDTVKGVLGIHSPSTVFEQLGINTDQGFANGIISGSSEIDSSLSSVFGDLGEKVDVSSMLGLGEEASGNFASGLLNGEGAVTEATTSLADASGTDVSSFLDIGNLGGDNFVQGLLNGKGDVDSTISSMVDVSGTDTSSFLDLGNLGGDNFVKGLLNGEGEVASTTKKITDAGKTDLSSYSNLGKSASDKFIKGFESGSKSKVSGAATSVANALSKSVKNAIGNTNYSAVGVKAMQSLVRGYKQGEGNAKSSIRQIAKTISNTIQSENASFTKQGKSSMTAYGNGMKSGVASVSTVIKSLTKTVSNSFKNNEETFRKSGKSNLKAYEDGLKSAKSSSVKTVKQFSAKLLDTLNSNISKFRKSGSDTGKKYTSSLNSALKSGGSTLAKTAMSIGKQYVQGVANGLTANSAIAANAARRMAQQIDQTVKNTLDIHSPSKKGEERGKQYDEGVKEGITKNKSLVSKAASDMADELDKEMLGRVSKGFETGSKIADFAGSFAEINQKRRENLANETMYWMKLLAVKKQGADAERYQDMDLIEFKKDILAQEKEISDNYKEQVANQMESLSQQLDLWSEVDSSLKRTRKEQAEFEAAQEASTKNTEKNAKQSKKVTKTLTEQMRDQAKTYENYAKIMSNLQKRLKGTDILAEINQMGVDQLPILKEINQMTDKELKQLEKTYDDRNTQIGKAVKVLSKDLTKETKDALNKLYETGVSGAARDKALKQSGLFAEQNYWEQLLAIKKSGAAAEQYQDMTISEFRKNILEETQKILDDYQSQFEQTKDNIVSQMDLFTTVEQKQVASKEELMQILNDQVNAYKQYGETLESLSNRLQGTNLLTYLKSLGVNSLAELQTINSMTDEELSQYAALYDQKLEQAGIAANTKMTDIQSETQKKLQELFNVAGDIDLTQFQAKFDGTIQSIEGYLASLQEPINKTPAEVTKSATSIISALANGLGSGADQVLGSATKLTSGVLLAFTTTLMQAQTPAKETGNKLAENAASGITAGNDKFSKGGSKNANAYLNGIKGKYGNAKSTGSTLSNNSVNGVQQNTSKFQEIGTAQGTSYSQGLNNSSSLVTSAGQYIAEAAINEVRRLDNDFYGYGVNAGQGLAEGLKSQAAEVKAAAAELANAASTETQEELEVNSPSKVMARIGSFAGEGFVTGLLKFVSKAANAAKEIAGAAVDGATSTYDSITSILTDDMFTDPTIRPFVDLTNAREAANEILSMFNNVISSTSVGALELNSNIRSERNRKLNGDQNDSATAGQQGGGSTYSFTQNNYSPKPLSSIDIYRQTNNQFELFKRTVNV